MTKSNLFKKAVDICKDRKKEPLLGIYFLKCAKMDFEAAKILHNAKLYSLSMYHIQQCVEKLIKSMLLYIGTINKEQLRKINHYTPKAFIEYLNDEGLMRIMQEANAFLEDPELAKKKISDFMDRGEERIAGMNKEGIEEFLKLTKMDKIESYIKKTPSIGKTELQEGIKYAKNISKKPINLNYDNVMDFGLSVGKLFPLALITFAHSQFSRYPDGKIKPFHYDNLGITLAFEGIIKQLDFIISSFSQFIK